MPTTTKVHEKFLSTNVAKMCAIKNSQHTKTTRKKTEVKNKKQVERKCKFSKTNIREIKRSPKKVLGIIGF